MASNVNEQAVGASVSHVSSTASLRRFGKHKSLCCLNYLTAGLTPENFPLSVLIPAMATVASVHHVYVLKPNNVVFFTRFQAEKLHHRLHHPGERLHETA